MNIGNYSSTARPLDFSWVSNRIIAICCAVAWIAAGVLFYSYTQPDILEALWFGLKISLAVFFSWAISRELIPDINWPAFLAVALASVGLFWWPDVDLLMCFCLLLLTRIINRSSGIAAKTFDVLLLLILTGLLLYQAHVIIGVAVMVGFWINHKLPEPQPSHKNVAGITLILIILSFYFEPIIVSPEELPTSLTTFAIAIATFFALIIRQMKTITSLTDDGTKKMDLKRVKSANLLLLCTVTAVTLWLGIIGFVKLLPFWAAFTSSALGYLTARKK